jgi:TonB family protein
MNAGAANPKMESQTSQSAFLIARTQREAFLRHFGFRESPFGVTPDPEFLFWSRMHSAALQAMIDSIESNLGFSVLLGKPGTGKTSLLFHLLAQYRESARTAFIFQTQCRPHDLIRHIASELDLPTLSRDEVSLHQKLNGMLLKEARAGRKVLIVIDEAQNLQSASLEAIRLLSDFETGFSKLLNVVLSGSPRLGEMLLSSELSQLAQRISTISRLEPLAGEEVKKYVRFRLAVVATRANEGLFSADSLAEVASQSGGVPRVINSICYRALILAYTQGRLSVSKELVQEAARDLDFSEPSNRDSKVAIQFTVAPDPPLSNGVPAAVSREEHVPANVAGDSREFPRGPIAQTQTFVQEERTPDVDARGLPQTAHLPPRVKSPGINLRGQPVISAKTNQPPRIRLHAINQFKSGDWYRHRSTGLIALLALLAFVSWLGWNELGAKSNVNVEGTSRSQPESLGSQVQPSTQGVNNGVPQNYVQQPTGPGTTPSTGASTRQSPANQIQSMIDVGPNLLLPSKIHAQPLTAAQAPMAPATVEIMSKTTNNSAIPVAAYTPAVPRLEASKPVGRSGPKTNFSPEAIKVIQPEYPPKAKLWHIEGEVLVELTIDRNGNVQKVRSLSGNAILLQAAEDAVRQWKYSPAADDQVSIPTVTRVRFNFKLDPEARNR